MSDLDILNASTDQIAEEKRRRLERFVQLNKSKVVSADFAAIPKTIRLVAQGDSWFDYPFRFRDIIQNLDPYAGSSGDTPPWRAIEIMSLAHYGEAMTSMTGVKKLHELGELLKVSDLGPVDGILFSGGGNDLAGDQFRMWLKETTAVKSDPKEALNVERVNAILNVIKGGYEDLIALRDQLAPGVPIFVHSYDFAIPDGRKHPCAGPWLQPGFHDRGWMNDAANRDIVKELLLQFSKMMDDFANHTFIHVNVQGLLPGHDDWDNELHPSKDGFVRIAGAFREAIKKRLLP